MRGQRRHEAPDLGDAIVRMLRGLVKRAAEGDTEAVEQLQRIAGLAPAAARIGVRLAHDDAGYSWTELGTVLGVSRQAAQQQAQLIPPTVGAGHVLVPGHNRRTCSTCNTPNN